MPRDASEILQSYVRVRSSSSRNWIGNRGIQNFRKSLEAPGNGSRPNASDWSPYKADNPKSEFMNRKLRFLMLCADLVWIAIAFVLAHLVRSGLSQDSTTSVRFLYVPAILVSFSIWITLYFNKRLEGFCGWHLPSVSARVIAGVFYLMGSLLAVGFLFKYDYSRLALFYLACLLPAGFIAIRCIANWMMTSRPRTRPKRRVVILGSGRVARELAVKISRHPELLMEVAGVLFPSDTESSTKLLSMPLGTV